MNKAIITIFLLTILTSKLSVAQVRPQRDRSEPIPLPVVEPLPEVPSQVHPDVVHEPEIGDPISGDDDNNAVGVLPTDYADQPDGFDEDVNAPYVHPEVHALPVESDEDIGDQPDGFDEDVNAPYVHPEVHDLPDESDEDIGDQPDGFDEDVNAPYVHPEVHDLPDENDEDVGDQPDGFDEDVNAPYVHPEIHDLPVESDEGNQDDDANDDNQPYQHPLIHDLPDEDTDADAAGNDDDNQPYVHPLVHDEEAQDPDLDEDAYEPTEPLGASNEAFEADITLDQPDENDEEISEPYVHPEVHDSEAQLNENDEDQANDNDDSTDQPYQHPLIHDTNDDDADADAAGDQDDINDDEPYVHPLIHDDEGQDPDNDEDAYEPTETQGASNEAFLEPDASSNQLDDGINDQEPYVHPLIHDADDDLDDQNDDNYDYVNQPYVHPLIHDANDDQEAERTSADANDDKQSDSVLDEGMDDYQNVHPEVHDPNLQDVEKRAASNGVYSHPLIHDEDAGDHDSDDGDHKPANHIPPHHWDTIMVPDFDDNDEHVKNAKDGHGIPKGLVRHGSNEVSLTIGNATITLHDSNDQIIKTLEAAYDNYVNSQSQNVSTIESEIQQDPQQALKDAISLVSLIQDGLGNQEGSEANPTTISNELPETGDGFDNVADVQSKDIPDDSSLVNDASTADSVITSVAPDAENDLNDGSTISKTYTSMGQKMNNVVDTVKEEVKDAASKVGSGLRDALDTLKGGQNAESNDANSYPQPPDDGGV